jgi:hypothetical protein
VDNETDIALSEERHPTIDLPALIRQYAELPKKRGGTHLSLSIGGVPVSNVRQLARKLQTSDSAIVEAALRDFFDCGGEPHLRGIVEKLITVHRRRRA